MFDHLNPHPNTHRWGRYWQDAAVPQNLPVTDPGRPFRFAYADTNATMAEMTLFSFNNNIILSQMYGCPE